MAKFDQIEPHHFDFLKNTSLHPDHSARWYAGGDIAARCPYLADGRQVLVSLGDELRYMCGSYRL